MEGGEEGDPGGGGMPPVDILHAMMRTEDDDIDEAAAHEALAAAPGLRAPDERGEERSLFAATAALSVRRGAASHGALHAAMALGLAGVDPALLERAAGSAGSPSVLQVRSGVASLVPHARAAATAAAGGPPGERGGSAERRFGGAAAAAAELERLEEQLRALRGISGRGGERLEALMMARMAGMRGAAGAAAAAASMSPYAPAAAAAATAAAPTNLWIEFEGGQRIVVADAGRVTVADCMLAARQLCVEDVSRLWSRVYCLSFGTAPRAATAARRGRAFLHDAGAGPRSRVVRTLIDATIARASHETLFGAVASEQATPARLLLVLHGLASWWPRHLHEAGDDGAAADAAAAFAAIPWRNERLTGHFMREMQDPVAVCTGQVVHACGEVAMLCPFLLPLAVRMRLFDMTAFGVGRALYLLDEEMDAARLLAHTRLRPEQRERRFSPPQQKCELERDDVLQSAMSLLRHANALESELSIQFTGETGHGLGPTIEFYTLVCRELQLSSLGLWVSEEVRPMDAASELTDASVSMDGSVEASVMSPTPGRLVASTSVAGTPAVTPRGAHLVTDFVYAPEVRHVRSRAREWCVRVRVCACVRGCVSVCVRACV